MPILALCGDVPDEVRAELTAERRQGILDQLPGTLQMIAAFWRQPDPGFPCREPAQSSKVRCNGPCSCDSGKKFKKCCGAASSPQTCIDGPADAKKAHMRPGSAPASNPDHRHLIRRQAFIAPALRTSSREPTNQAAPGLPPLTQLGSGPASGDLPQLLPLLTSARLAFLTESASGRGDRSLGKCNRDTPRMGISRSLLGTSLDFPNVKAQRKSADGECVRAHADLPLDVAPS